MRSVIGALLLAAVLLAAPAGASATVGLVLLHGKTGMPGQFAKLSAALRGAGYLVDTPQLCWSKKRIYDERLADCLSDVDRAVADLKAKGATSIVVGGTSLGALVAFDYADTHPGFAGVIAMAPAGNPSAAAKAPAIAQSIAAADADIKAGKGDEPVSFADLENATPITVTATPRTLLDFVGPKSPLAMAETLPKEHAPLLWVAGTRDDTQSDAPKAFAKVPKNRLNRLATVDADHVGTPDASVDAVLSWLATLSGKS